MSKSQEAELKYPFHVIPDDGVYVIAVPDLPGCMTVANRAEDIGAMTADAIRAWARRATMLGRDVPAPGSSGPNELPWWESPPVSADVPPAVSQPAASANGGRASGNGRSRTGPKPKSSKATV